MKHSTSGHADTRRVPLAAAKLKGGQPNNSQTNRKFIVFSYPPPPLLSLSVPLAPHLSTPERRLRTSTASTNSRRRTRPATPAVPYLSSTSITSTDTCKRGQRTNGRR